MTTLYCHACGQFVPDESPSRHGFLINEEARLGAKLVELKTQLLHMSTGGDGYLIRESLQQQIEEAERRREEVLREIGELQ